VNHEINVQQVTVNAIGSGDVVILVDRHGRPLSCKKRLSDLEGVLDYRVLRAWEWRLAVQRMKSRLSGRSGRRRMTPWKRKTQSLAASLRLRRRFSPSKARGRQRFQCYSTRTWSDAKTRLWEQGNNRFRRHSRGGWVRWAHTVSNNHNKRKGGRYANTSNCHRQDDHGTH